MKVFLVIVGLILFVMLVLVGFFLGFPGKLRVVYPEDDIVQNGFLISGNVRWEFDGEEWVAHGNPPKCPDLMTLPSPVDVSLVSGILYPGQMRGGDYKPHGGFRFDNHDDNTVDVRAVMDGYLLKAAKYNDGYDTQIQIFYVNDCGIMVMHDHIYKLSPKLAEALRDVPVGQNGDSRTTNIEERVYIEKGEVLATEVGYPVFPGGHNGKNTFVDFGLYDLRQTNGVLYRDTFRSENQSVVEYGAYALCWLDNLEEASVVKSLPVGGSEGSLSDYCE